MLEILLSIYNFFSGSRIHLEFESQQKRLISQGKMSELRNITLKRHCDTRWVSRFDCVDSVLKTMPAILCTLDVFSEDRDSERRQKARFLISQLDTDFVTNLVILHEALGHTKKLTKILQEEPLDLSSAVDYVTAVKEQLNDMCSESEWNTLWNMVANICKKAEIPPPMDRKRRKAFPDLLNQNIHQPCKTKDDYFWRVLQPLVLSMVSELNRRFNEENSCLYRGVSSLTPKHALFLKLEPLIDFGKSFGMKNDDVKDELCTLSKFFNRKCANQEFIKPKSLSEFHSFLTVYKETFLNIYNLCTISICLAISSAGCERGFSAMKRIKSYCRSTMSDMRLSNLAVLHVGCDRTTKLNMKEVIDRFAKSGNRRMTLF